MLSEPSRNRISTTVRTVRGPGLTHSRTASLRSRKCQGSSSPYGPQNRIRTRRIPLVSARDVVLFGLLEAVLAVHAGALVHVGLGYVGASTAGDAFFDALADKAAHEEGATLYAPIGLGIPGDPLCVRQGGPLSSSLRIYSTV